MHIGLVSSHYPPNFVSGGTLVPQRIAEGFAARGHQVSVFAGSFEDGLADLSVRHEISPGGVQIQWTTISGMLLWADEVNYANKEVEEEFSRWLVRTGPDVVHFHNLQGMGGSLVSAAAAYGAAVLVTMHDMWWWCARQFLVDRHLQPCASVVDCGVCACERNNAWLNRRNYGLSAHLRHADLVLAPSSTMVDLLSANGIAPDRLALDENPSPDSVPEAAVRQSDHDGTVRFIFAGGKHLVKGVTVAVDAARTLGDLTGWSLDLYGAQVHDLPPGVRSLPPYDSADASSILSRYDVLLMSSVMLESYSLLTREALTAGCAVITGDNPGPAEVVKDRVNGLVVARGDTDAFGDAMRRLITDRDLLARLQPPPGSLPMRQLSDQLDNLLLHYTQLIDRRRAVSTAVATATAAAPVGAIENPSLTVGSVRDLALNPIRRVLIVSGITGAPLRYRGFLAKEALESVGVQADVHMYRDAEVPRRARTADAVVFYRVPATEQVLDLIDMIRTRTEPVPVLFDIDDLIFDPSIRTQLDPVLTKVAGVDLDLYWQGIRRYRTTLEAADAYIGSTVMLCQQVSALTGIPTHRWHNGVGRQVARISDFELYRPRMSGPVRMGYLSGTNTHNEDWAFVEPAIARVMRLRPGVELWIGGLLDPSSALREFGGRIRRLPLKPWTELPGVLRDLDINLAPLEPDKSFNEAKSAIKWLEAALTRTPTVATPTQPFREAIRHGSTGLLAETVDDWVDALLELIDDALLRHRIGHAAREQAQLTLTPSLQGHRYLDILTAARDSVDRDGHRETFVDWTPEVISEPYIIQPTDEYGPPARGLVVRPRGLSGIRNLGRAARDTGIGAISMLRRDGIVATANKILSVAGALPARAAARRR